ncbi:MAG TPA: antibiotic biosynthesis monooxygenase [Phenylobacterium sp.]|nr:antibiotic biosynthesis monooxygenase [Phenylobacterium sp.]
MPIVSATRLRVRGLLHFPAFFVATNRSKGQAERSKGFLAGQLVIDRGRVFWTVTVWRDLEAMRAYRNSGAHLAAMRKIGSWCDEAATATWDQADAGMPSLDEVGRRMVAEGRAVKLPHASRAHLSSEGPMPPRPRAIQGMRARPPSP